MERELQQRAKLAGSRVLGRGAHLSGGQERGLAENLQPVSNFERKYQAVTAENDPTKGWTDQDVKNYLEYYRATGRVFWPQWAGPKPNQPGFRWPDQLIDADLE